MSAVPEPGSKSYDKHRARRRKDLERSGAADAQEANEQAKRDLERDPEWRPTGPRSERGRGPKSERPGTE
ncbi:hypothetical protein ACH4LN_03435 [Streptomyces albus]|uniref:hypothetical protein n=1 Tax=Streptomyces TaxID=1883 RepID=UPI001CEE06A5|nr:MULTISPECIES: hypothetical protein [Streptomyces]MDI6411705.1 hypothetical protein [Streptomyces albus]UVN53747.1 hypothetical protein NR995_03825 [Streptomyces albus]